MISKASIVELLRTNDKAIARALVALNDRQTLDEQATEDVRYRNGMGFRPCHARMGTSMAKFFTARGYLSPKQIAYWRKPSAKGGMRIEIYAGQLLLVAEAKATQAKQAAAIAVVANIVNPAPAQRTPSTPATAPKSTLAAQAMLSEREMQAMEAQADRDQTRDEELNKFLARCQMEKG
jgi:hypothetical protein